MGRLDLQWNVGTDLSVSTRFFWMFSSGSPSASDAVTFASQGFNAAATMHSLWGPSTILVGAKWTDLSSSTGNVGEHAGSQAGTTTSTGVLPGSTCLLVNYLTNRRYRGGHPRAYLPFGMSSDLLSRQQWGSTFLSTATSQFGAFLGTLGTTTSSGITWTQHSNVSYYQGFTVVTNPSTGRAHNKPTLRPTPHVDPITSWALSVVPGSQRRRN